MILKRKRSGLTFQHLRCWLPVDLALVVQDYVGDTKNHLAWLLPKFAGLADSKDGFCLMLDASQKERVVWNMNYRMNCSVGFLRFFFRLFDDGNYRFIYTLYDTDHTIRESAMFDFESEADPLTAKLEDEFFSSIVVARTGQEVNGAVERAIRVTIQNKYNRERTKCISNDTISRRKKHRRKCHLLGSCSRFADRGTPRIRGQNCARRCFA